MFFPEDASSAGHWVDELFYLAFWLTTITFAIVIGILVYFLIRYRSVPGRKAHYTRGESLKARVWTILFAVFIFIIIDVNLAFHDHHAWEKTWGSYVRGTPLRIQVLAQQFAWNIRYPGPDGKFNTADDLTTVNQMHIPAGRPVILAMKSKDVIHSFFLPNFRIKQDVVPGLVTMMSFKAEKMGDFDIACAEHCGLGHYRMRGVLTSESAEAFDQWMVKKAQAGGNDTSWGWDWKL